MAAVLLTMLDLVIFLRIWRITTEITERDVIMLFFHLGVDSIHLIVLDHSVFVCPLFVYKLRG